MGVSIQQWRNTIGCYQAKYSRKVSRTHKLSSASFFTRPTIFTLAIFTIFAVSLSSYSILSSVQSTTSWAPSSTTCRSISAHLFINIDHLPPWPPDSCTKPWSRLPTSPPATSPTHQQHWAIPLKHVSPKYSEFKATPLHHTLSSCRSSPCSSSTPYGSLWLSTWSSTRIPGWTTSSQGKALRIVKNNFWARYIYGNRNKGIKL